MFVAVTPETIQLPPGTVLRLSGNWQDYQMLSQQLGDRSIPRIKYRPGEILLMVPLPEHGRDAHLIAHAVTVLLDQTERDYEAFTPITMELPQESGIEPDYCFYINNWAAVAGKRRIDWENDPPPDLAIEIDVTSYTKVSDYLVYRVPEVWLWKRERLQIHQLQGDRYEKVNRSRYFPEIDVGKAIARCFQVAYERNTSQAIRDLRQQL
ncbi:MAG: Uma2 family endonuclease [Cyanobacteriota bacterium]|nr:Uma2 family endonuclease [Cyanobacteriota bacterium]